MQAKGVGFIFSAVEVSLDWRKVVFVIAGSLISLLFFTIFMALTAVIDSGWLSALVALLGVLLVWAINSMVVGGVAKMSYDELAGRPIVKNLQALKFAAKHLPSLLLSPFVLWLVVVAIFIIETLLFQLGRLPSVGPVLLALLFIPLVLVNMLLLIVLLVGLWLIPAIVAGEALGPVETLRKVRTLLRQWSKRLGISFVTMLLLSFAFGMILLAFVSFVASQTFALSLTAQPGGYGLQSLPASFGLSVLSLSGLMPQSLSALGSFGGVGVTTGIAGLLMLLAWLLLAVVTTAIPFVIFPVASACATYFSLAGGAPGHLPAGNQQPGAQSQGAPVVSEPSADQNEPAKRYCNQCGSPLGSNATFCGKCGTAVHS